MGKVKMRCARCGKPFKSAGAKQTLCYDCETKARRERANEKVTAAKQTASPATVAHAPRIVGPGASILGATPTPATSGAGGRDADASTSRPFDSRDQPHGAQSRHSTPHRDTRADGPGASPAATERPQAAKSDLTEKRARAAKAPAPPKPRPERKPKPAPYTLTDETRQAIESRYLELAQPVEFDGIRTQIATELNVPKHLVKQVVRELRGQRQLPSWWELKSFTGSSTDLVRIRELYLPHLPVPPIGVHKVIAEQLSVEPANVYHAIRRIRAEMRLPQYNPPDAHKSPEGAPETAEAMGSRTSAD